MLNSVIKRYFKSLFGAYLMQVVGCIKMAVTLRAYIVLIDKLPVPVIKPPTTTTFIAAFTNTTTALATMLQ